MYFLKIKQKLCGGDYANEELLRPTAFITSALLVPLIYTKVPPLSLPAQLVSTLPRPAGSACRLPLSPDSLLGAAQPQLRLTAQMGGTSGAPFKKTPFTAHPPFPVVT